MQARTKRLIARTLGLLWVGFCLGQTGCRHVGFGQHRPSVAAAVGDIDFDPQTLKDGPNEALQEGQDGAPMAVLGHTPKATPTHQTDPKDIGQAQAALLRGQHAYHRGDYQLAEEAFKQAMVLHPFLAQAHLSLGKIYLLRGVAADDAGRLQKGRRMIEMALRLDASLAEATVFLDYFPR